MKGGVCVGGSVRAFNIHVHRFANVLVFHAVPPSCSPCTSTVIASDSRNKPVTGEQREPFCKKEVTKAENKEGRTWLLQNSIVSPQMRNMERRQMLKSQTELREKRACSRAFHTWQRLPGTKGSVIFNAWPPVYLIRLHHYFCYQGNTQLN